MPLEDAAPARRPATMGMAFWMLLATGVLWAVAVWPTPAGLPLAALAVVPLIAAPALRRGSRAAYRAGLAWSAALLLTLLVSFAGGFLAVGLDLLNTSLPDGLEWAGVMRETIFAANEPAYLMLFPPAIVAVVVLPRRDLRLFFSGPSRPGTPGGSGPWDRRGGRG